MFASFSPNKPHNVDKMFCAAKGTCGSTPKAEEDAQKVGLLNMLN